MKFRYTSIHSKPRQLQRTSYTLPLRQLKPSVRADGIEQLAPQRA
jgi:hypothetical protein